MLPNVKLESYVIAGKVLDADSEDLLAQEIDAIDSPMAGEPPKRPTVLCLPSKPDLNDR